MTKTYIDKMFTDREYDALYDMGRGTLVEVVAKRAIMTASKLFLEQSKILKGSITYDEVAAELKVIAETIQ